MQKLQSNRDTYDMAQYDVSDGLGDEIHVVDGIRTSKFEKSPSLTFDKYLLENYEVNDDKEVVQKYDTFDDFKPSKREPEIGQTMPYNIPGNSRNYSIFKNSEFGETVTVLPDLLQKEYGRLSKNEYKINAKNKNDKPFIAKSHHSNSAPLQEIERSKLPTKSLGYQAAKMAQKYRDKRRNKKKIKIRKKLAKPKDFRNKGQSRPRKNRPSSTVSFNNDSPAKRNIGVAIGITSNRLNPPSMFAQNHAEEFYYSHPTFNGEVEFDPDDNKQYQSVTYSSSPPYYKPISKYLNYENPIISEYTKTSDKIRPISPYDSKDNALLLLAPSGPRMPIFNRIASDMSDMMSSSFDPSLSAKVGSSMYKNGMYIMNKIGSGTLDGEMDVFDFLPIIGVIVAGALLVAGLFPTALTSFGFNNGQFVIGRKLHEKNGRHDTEVEESIFGITLNHLEAGMMLMNAIRLEDGGCTEKLACRMNEAFHRYSDETSSDRDARWLVNAMDLVMPKTFQDSIFSKSLRTVLENDDNSSCSRECYRCVAL